MGCCSYKDTINLTKIMLSDRRQTRRGGCTDSIFFLIEKETREVLAHVSEEERGSPQEAGQGSPGRGRRESSGSLLMTIF